jgi:hypothetical protein
MRCLRNIENPQLLIRLFRNILMRVQGMAYSGFKPF